MSFGNLQSARPLQAGSKADFLTNCSLTRVNAGEAGAGTAEHSGKLFYSEVFASFLTVNFVMVNEPSVK